jgi:hypothetical protein
MFANHANQIHTEITSSRSASPGELGAQAEKKL